METKQITLNRFELDNIISAILMTCVNIDAQTYPNFSEALDELYNKLSNIREVWDKEIKEGARLGTHLSNSSLTTKQQPQ